MFRNKSKSEKLTCPIWALFTGFIIGICLGEFLTVFVSVDFAEQLRNEQFNFEKRVIIDVRQPIFGNDTFFTMNDEIDYHNSCSLLALAAQGASYLIHKSDFSQILYLYDEYYMHFKTNETYLQWPKPSVIVKKLKLLPNSSDEWFESEEYKQTMNHLSTLNYSISVDGEYKGLTSTTNGVILVTVVTIDQCKNRKKNGISDETMLFYLIDLLLHEFLHVKYYQIFSKYNWNNGVINNIASYGAYFFRPWLFLGDIVENGAPFKDVEDSNYCLQTLLMASYYYISCITPTVSVIDHWKMMADTMKNELNDVHSIVYYKNEAYTQHKIRISHSWINAIIENIKTKKPIWFQSREMRYLILDQSVKRQNNKESIATIDDPIVTSFNCSTAKRFPRIGFICPEFAPVALKELWHKNRYHPNGTSIWRT